MTKLQGLDRIYSYRLKGVKKPKAQALKRIEVPETPPLKGVQMPSPVREIKRAGFRPIPEADKDPITPKKSSGLGYPTVNVISGSGTKRIPNRPLSEAHTPWLNKKPVKKKSSGFSSGSFAPKGDYGFDVPKLKVGEFDKVGNVDMGPTKVRSLPRSHPDHPDRKNFKKKWYHDKKKVMAVGGVAGATLGGVLGAKGVFSGGLAALGRLLRGSKTVSRGTPNAKDPLNKVLHKQNPPKSNYPTSSSSKEIESVLTNRPGVPPAVPKGQPRVGSTSTRVEPPPIPKDALKSRPTFPRLRTDRSPKPSNNPRVFPRQGSGRLPNAPKKPVKPSFGQKVKGKIQQLKDYKSLRKISKPKVKPKKSLSQSVKDKVQQVKDYRTLKKVSKPKAVKKVSKAKAVKKGERPVNVDKRVKKNHPQGPYWSPNSPKIGKPSTEAVVAGSMLVGGAASVAGKRIYDNQKNKKKKSPRDYKPRYSMFPNGIIPKFNDYKKPSSKYGPQMIR